MMARPEAREVTGRAGCGWFSVNKARPIADAIDDGPGKRLVIRDIIFEGDLENTRKWLGNASRLIALANYDRVELIDVEGRWGSQTGFHLAYCDDVRATRINLNRIAAIGLDVSNCANIAVTDGDFAWIVDNCCAARLAAAAAADLGQQRTFQFIGNRVYHCRGVGLLGGRHAIIVGNSFRVPTNYAVFVGADEAAGEGLRVSEDILISANNITDLLTGEQIGSEFGYNVGILVSQFAYNPHNVIVRGNTLAQRTAGTDGLDRSALKLRGIAGQNRQWRRSTPTGDVMYYDT